MAPSRSLLLTRFFADFTLGFSDGLTVPFALTAGLGYLGRSQTVIYAGMAELCAGCISMGIGGYLAAVDELPSSNPAAEETCDEDDADSEEMAGMLRERIGSKGLSRDSTDEKTSDSHEDAIRRHLEPLALPNTTIDSVLSAISANPDGLAHAFSTLRSHRDAYEKASAADAVPIVPVLSGLFISLGYLVGGTIPLLPYFFAPTVGVAMRWSVALCLVALFVFGYGKAWALRGGAATWRRCLFEGLQMLVLGSVAAAAAVLCVNLVDAAAGGSKGDAEE